MIGKIISAGILLIFSMVAIWKIAKETRRAARTSGETDETSPTTAVSASLFQREIWRITLNFLSWTKAALSSVPIRVIFLYGGILLLLWIVNQKWFAAFYERRNIFWGLPMAVILYGLISSLEKDQTKRWGIKMAMRAGTAAVSAILIGGMYFSLAGERKIDIVNPLLNIGQRMDNFIFGSANASHREAQKDNGVSWTFNSTGKEAVCLLNPGQVSRVPHAPRGKSISFHNDGGLIILYNKGQVKLAKEDRLDSSIAKSLGLHSRAMPRFKCPAEATEPITVSIRYN